MADNKLMAGLYILVGVQMKTVLVSLLFLVLLLWGVSFTHADNVNILWLIRQDALNLTGFLAIFYVFGGISFHSS